MQCLGLLSDILDSKDFSLPRVCWCPVCFRMGLLLGPSVAILGIDSSCRCILFFTWLWLRVRQFLNNDRQHSALSEQYFGLSNQMINVLIFLSH